MPKGIAKDPARQSRLISEAQKRSWKSGTRKVRPPMTKEHCEAISRGRKKSWKENPNQGRKGKYASDATRKLQSDRIREHWATGREGQFIKSRYMQNEVPCDSKAECVFVALSEYMGNVVVRWCMGHILYGKDRNRWTPDFIEISPLGVTRVVEVKGLGEPPVHASAQMLSGQKTCRGVAEKHESAPHIHIINAGASPARRLYKKLLAAGEIESWEELSHA